MEQRSVEKLLQCCHFLGFEEGCRDFMQMQLGNVEKKMACKASVLVQIWTISAIL